MKRVLVNSSNKEEVRVALTDGAEVIDLDIQSSLSPNTRSNVYKGVVTRVESSLEAAFVEYGTGKQGFLPFKELNEDLFSVLPKGFKGKSSIEDILQEGQEIIVQIQKEARGNKGATLTTFVALAGTYIVMMPNNPNLCGISKHIHTNREYLKKRIRQLSSEAKAGIILRTAGQNRNDEELQWNIDYLKHLWEQIKTSSASHAAPCFLYQESDVVIRAIRDHLFYKLDGIYIDDKETYLRVKDYLTIVKPDMINKIHKYSSNIPIFSQFQIESQIETAFAHNVLLPSGGEIVIDTTEALTSIDVNSSRANKGQDVEETAFSTNLEATKEIAKQIRLRDLGGLIIIDFIDMKIRSHNSAVEELLQKEIQKDRAQMRISKISSFGLLEMSRQRLGSALYTSSHLVCPRCNGRSIVRSTESISFSILRIVEEYAINKSVKTININVPVEVKDFLQNERIELIQAIEGSYNVKVSIRHSESMQTPDYEIETNIPRISMRNYTHGLNGNSNERNPEKQYLNLHQDRPSIANPMLNFIKTHGTVKPPNSLIRVLKLLFKSIFGTSKKTKIISKNTKSKPFKKSTNSGSKTNRSATRNVKSKKGTDSKVTSSSKTRRAPTTNKRSLNRSTTSTPRRRKPTNDDKGNNRNVIQKETLTLKPNNSKKAESRSSDGANEQIQHATEKTLVNPTYGEKQVAGRSKSRRSRNLAGRK